MADKIISIISNSILAVCGIVFFIFIVSSFLPHFTFKFKPTSRKIYGRGIKKILFDGGHCVVYEPKYEIRQYVDQYSLIKKNDSKYIKCKINKSINSLQYELVAFNSKNKIIDYLSINESISDLGYTRAVEIPFNTSYVEFVLRKVNNKKIHITQNPVKYSPLCLSVYIVLVSFCTAAVAKLIRFSASNILGEFNLVGNFSPTFLVGSFVGGVICGCIVIFRYTVKLKREGHK